MAAQGIVNKANKLFHITFAQEVYWARTSAEKRMSWDVVGPPQEYGWDEPMYWIARLSVLREAGFKVRWKTVI